MAAVEKVKVHPISPPGAFETRAFAAQAKVALEAGDLVQIASDTPNWMYPFVVELLSTANADANIKTFVVLMDQPNVGSQVNIADKVEMDGFSGAGGQGAPLYPSASTAGAIATDVIEIDYTDDNTDIVAIPAPAKIWALTDTRLLFDL